MNHTDGKVGMQVLFGRIHGEKTLGEIVKVNPKKFKVKQLEGRGSFRDYPVGTIWTVPAALCSVVTAEGSVRPSVALPVQMPERGRRRWMATEGG
jgi:hypothetical protein